MEDSCPKLLNGLINYLNGSLNHEDFMKTLLEGATTGNDESMGGVTKDKAKAFEFINHFITTYKQRDLVEEGEGNERKHNPTTDSEKLRYRHLLFVYGAYLLGTGGANNDSTENTEKNTKKGLALLEEACVLGHMGFGLCSVLGQIYATGTKAAIGVQRKPTKAIHWLSQSAKMGNGSSAFKLSAIFRSGAVPVNFLMTEKWELVAKKLGYPVPDKEPHDRRCLTKDTARKLLHDIQNDVNFIIDVIGIDDTYTCSNPNCNNVDEEAKATECGSFALCSRCLHVKYCSPRCQKIHYRAGHKMECKDLEKDMMDLKVANANVAFPSVQCFNPSCARIEKDDSENFSQCSRCKHAKYCSKDCQVSHWPGHKKDCKYIVTLLQDADKILSQDLEDGDGKATKI